VIIFVYFSPLWGMLYQENLATLQTTVEKWRETKNGAKF
jgi:hypothetical protein